MSCMRIEKMGEYAKFNLRMINDQGSQAEQTKRLVEKMKELQEQASAKLSQPSEHMQKFNNSLKKLDVI